MYAALMLNQVTDWEFLNEVEGADVFQNVLWREFTLMGEIKHTKHESLIQISATINNYRRC